MFRDKKIIVVMPAYNAARTLRQTHAEVLEQDIVDEIILVDDASNDETTTIARTLSKTTVYVQSRNRGYGANQKKCYQLALEKNADIIVMVHPDYQYTPKLIPAMASLITSGLYHCVLGSRILGGGAIKGGMPVWKYLSNRVLTLIQNLLMGTKLSEYHTGYRAFSRELLAQLPLEQNSDDFLFDNQILAQILARGYAIAEVTCPTKYFPEASSINFQRSMQYGIGCLLTGIRYRLGAFRN
jgi:glycosyltransferase involved in cell wall biosynthesis